MPGGEDPLSLGASAAQPIVSLDEAMRQHIQRALAATKGRIEGPFGAAALLDINPHTLRARMRRLGIDWAAYRPGRSKGLDERHREPSNPCP